MAKETVTKLKSGQRGRPTKFTQAIANEIILRTKDGQTLLSICKDEHMPGRVTVYDWLSKNKDFSEQFARAREVGAGSLIEECIDIADNEINDVKSKAAVLRARLKVDTRMKVLALWFPERYGTAKSKVELTGKDEGPVEINENVRIARINALVALAKARKDKDGEH